MSKLTDIKGQTFNGLTVIQKSTRTDPKQRAFWICRCHCGRLIDVRGDALRLGRAKQCSICSGNRGRLSRFLQEGETHG